MFNRLSIYSPQALALLRIVVALLFIEHGTQKLFGFPAAPEQGMPQLLSLGGNAAIMEFAGGILVLIGLFTRPVAFLLSGEMAVAYWMVHFANGGFFPILNRGDLAILFCFVFLYLFFAGPGAWAVDTRRDSV